MFFTLIKQEFLIQIKNPSGLINSLIFFLITASIFAITADINNSKIAIAIIWICLTFAILLSQNQQFQKDFNDGTLEQLYLSGYIFELIILTKIFANWLFNALPLIAILPIIALILKIDNGLMKDLILIAAIVSLIINFLVNFAASLILSTKNNHNLLIILVLPLVIPAIIFANSGLDTNTNAISIKMLLALLIFLAPILTFATASAIKINLVDV